MPLKDIYLFYLDSFSINLPSTQHSTKLVLGVGDTSKVNNSLQILLLSSLQLDFIMLVVIFTILFILYNKYYGPFFLIKKIIFIFFSNNTKERLEKIFNKGSIFTDRFTYILLTINILNLIFILFLKIYLHSELYSNLDSYVSVYNESKKGLLLLFITNINIYSKLPNYLQRLIRLFFICLLILRVFKTIYYREVLLYSVLLVLSFFLISP